MDKSNETSLVIPGTFLKIRGQGVLLSGPSAAGKSILSLELIHRGHRLVADDAVSFNKKGSRIFGKCPPSIQDFMHIRELGIINIRKIFRHFAICPKTELTLVIQLSTTTNKQIQAASLSEPYKTTRILGVEIPALTMSTHFASATLIETAVRDLFIKKKGYFAFNELHTQQQKFMNLSQDKNYDR